MVASLEARSEDLLVIGAGGAGLSAAVEAARRGARVRVLDAQAHQGGTAAAAGGGCFVAGSPLQERLGYEDSPTQALADWLRWGGSDVDEQWAQRYVEGSRREVYDWLGSLGVEWVDLHIQEGNSAPRWHQPHRGGAGVAAALAAAARDAGATIQSGTTVTELVVEAGRVVGVVAEHPDTGAVEYRAPAVLVASGGFNNNPDLVRRYGPRVAEGGRILCGGGLGALGRGHGLLERVNAQFVNLDVIWMYPFATPDFDDPEQKRGLVIRGIEQGEVWVNASGVRFHNEALRGGATGAPAVLAQRPPMCWSVIDADTAALLTVSDPRYRMASRPLRPMYDRLLAESPYIARGRTVEDLADAAGLPRTAFRETIATYNRYVELGLERDPEFGRPLAGVRPVARPPYYAIQFHPLARKNLGGVRTDLDCQVLDSEGRIIPGLFAAGEVAGMAGGRINGRAALEGTMLGPSIFSGRVAGLAAVGYTAPLPSA